MVHGNLSDNHCQWSESQETDQLEEFLHDVVINEILGVVQQQISILSVEGHAATGANNLRTQTSVNLCKAWHTSFSSHSIAVLTLSTTDSNGSQGLGIEPNKDLIRTNIRFSKDHCNSKEHKNELNLMCHALSIVFVQFIF